MSSAEPSATVSLNLPVHYHRDMHLVIWNWIRRWCERDSETCITEGLHPAGWDLSPKSPADILLELTRKIDVSEDSLHPYVVLGGEGNLAGSYLYDFAHAVCREGESLQYGILQQKMSWITMKQIIEYYLNDLVNYIQKINSVGWTSAEQNDIFELGIDWRVARSTMTVDKMRDLLIWNRYLTGRRVHIWRPVGWSGRNSPEGFHLQYFNGSIESYWVTVVSSMCGLSSQFDLSPSDLSDDYPSPPYDDTDEDTDEEDFQPEQTTTQPLTEEQVKKNTAIRKLQETLDSVQEDIGDGLYLQIMNIMMDNYIVS
jgi:hypothetical protein